MTSPALPEKPPRLAVVDLARGVALAAMIVYHGAWDLSLVGLVAEPVTDYLGWRLFARSIAASFLLLVGVSLALAARGPIDRRAFLRRLAMIAGAAALVTAGTFFALPRGFVFFGILHHIAAASVLALPFLRLPSAVVLAVAGLVLVAPFVLAAPVFDAPALLPLGLFTTTPETVDFVPILPWFAAVLVGIVLGRVLAERAPARLAAWRPVDPLSHLLVGAGRWSLTIYLLHQPLLLALLFGVAALIGPVGREARLEAAFAANCAEQCSVSGRDASECRALCRCVLDRSSATGLRPELLSGRLESAGRARLGEIVAACGRAP